MITQLFHLVKLIVEGSTWLIERSAKIEYEKRPRRKQSAEQSFVYVQEDGNVDALMPAIEMQFSIVYIETDGSARELNAEEQLYLMAAFAPGDGDRPYLKSKYKTLTPDGNMSGYLERRKLPENISVKPAPASSKSSPKNRSARISPLESKSAFQ